jgi:hypothetical protein
MSALHIAASSRARFFPRSLTDLGLAMLIGADRLHRAEGGGAPGRISTTSADPAKGQSSSTNNAAVFLGIGPARSGGPHSTKLTARPRPVTPPSAHTNGNA